jgi:serine/threonine protein kinase
MDLLTGGDLRYHLCKIRHFSEEETKFFIACLILGLEYIHSNNIIHRDIKPENLVSDENGYIRITDFGVAKINKEDNSSETSGTPGYMAPEVLMGINHSFSVDFFAIGIMGYEFMFGVRPYNGKNRKEIKQMVLKKQAKIDKSETDWSKESIDFINKCLKRKASKRLGYINGIIELKNHKWFEGYDWEKLYNKSILAPFIPKKEGNYDKKYCEMIEKCGDETLERYNNYLNKKNFTNLFLGYTYINLDLLQNNLNNETHTRFTTNSKQNKITISNNSNKKDIIKNNTNLINDNNNKKVNNKFNINNFNNINKKFNPPPLQMINYFSGFKNKENKPIKPEIISPVYKEEIEKNENNEIEKEIKEINNL